MLIVTLLSALFSDVHHYYLIAMLSYIRYYYPHYYDYFCSLYLLLCLVICIIITIVFMFSYVHYNYYHY